MKKNILLITVYIFFSACGNPSKFDENQLMNKKNPHKEVIYQVFTRLFGNTETANKSWGTIKENGVGKFADFTPKALEEIKNLGATYIWYTGVPHHAVITDYTAYGISNDDPDVVKGRAGSPYAVKDYYQVDPDLAVDPTQRMAEFEALIKRSHDAGLKVIIDIVPNHVARKYEGLNNPKGVTDFGKEDDTSVAYTKNNNFYYIPGQAFKVPEWKGGYQPLGGDPNPGTDHHFMEDPAKWTGNGARDAQPDTNDWYETVKVNYGVKPYGDTDFEHLPEDFRQKGYQQHYAFWKDKEVPSSWIKFRDIALFWIEKGVDGFRFDMAEMVPVEFWSYMNSTIKMVNPEAFLLAEVYNPSLYRDYIDQGKMDYLYDKVQLYDTIKHIMQGHGSTDAIAPIIQDQKNIQQHLLHFLENHDEQRIASPEFAGDANKGKPAMVVSSTISTSPTMVYFGQELGEPGAEDLGFGDPSRTSIFDYGSVPTVRRWVNNKNFDGGQSSPSELELRDFYKRLLNFTVKSPALMGQYADIHAYNRQHTEWYNDKVYCFVRFHESEKLIIVANFDPTDTFGFELQIPENIIDIWRLQEDVYNCKDQLYGKKTGVLKIKDGKGQMRVDIKPLQSFIFKVGKS